MSVLGVLGDLVEDIVIWQREPLRHATDTDVALVRTRGGSAANVAAYAAPLHATRFVGCVGTDAAGDALVVELRARGVDVRVQRSGTTGTIVVLVDPHGERTMLPYRGAATELSDVPPDWLAGLAHLHVPVYSLLTGPTSRTAIRCLESVRRGGATTSVDASSTGALERYGVDRMIERLARLAPDCVFANRDEAELLGLWDGDRPGAVRAGLPRTTIVVKDGADPTTVVEPAGAVTSVPVPAVPQVRDATGAGDAFAAGFLAARLGGLGPAAACEGGHACAASVLARPGAS